MTKKKASSVWQYVFLTIAALVSVFPIYYMVVSATNSNVDILAGRLLPGTYLIENWNSLVRDTDFLNCLFNSIKYTLIGATLAVILTSIAGYAFEMYHDKGKDKVIFILMLSVMIPQAATLIPLYTLFGKIGLLNTTLGFIMPYIATAFLVMLFRQSTRSFPLALVDAARLDGLSEIRIFVSIYFPTMKSTFATAFIVAFMQIWNEYFWSLVVLQSSTSKTLQMLLASLTDSYTSDYGLMMLLATLTTLPVAVIFFLLQSNFTNGITGSTKG